MVHLSFSSRRSSASNLAEDGGAGSRGASPRQSDDESSKLSRKSAGASLLGKLWPWGSDSSGGRVSGLFGSRNSQVCGGLSLSARYHYARCHSARYLSAR